MILINDATYGVQAVRPTLADRLAVRFGSHRLDTDLARGQSPDADVRHALRARMLLSGQTRRELSGALDRLARQPVGGAAVLSNRVPARLSGVLPELAALRTVVAGHGPVSVRGMAQLHLLVSDAANGMYGVGPALSRPHLRALLSEVRRSVPEVPAH